MKLPLFLLKQPFKTPKKSKELESMNQNLILSVLSAEVKGCVT